MASVDCGVGRMIGATASFSDRLIGAMPVVRHDRARTPASFATSLYAARCVSAWPRSEYASNNGWNQNYNTSNPGNQNNNNKTNNNRARAVRRPEAPKCNVTIEEIFLAYYDCRKNKRNTANALRFEADLERNLMALHRDLAAGTYQPGRSICFVVTYPKPREVWAANFRDRVVHHLIYNRVARRFYSAFSADSCACIPERGTHYAVARLERHLRSATQDWSRPAWVLQMDFANFFVSIQKRVLDAQLARRIDDPYTLHLARRVLWHDPTTNVYVKSRPGLMAMVPPHKSLFNSGGNGLPIGNLTSQFFANVYLDDLDQFVKRTLKIRHYVRYVDDLVIVGESSHELRAVAGQLAGFAEKPLGIRFHPSKTHIQRADQGINFVGYVVRPRARYLRRRAVAAAHRAAQFGCKNPRQTLNSYLGLMRSCDGYRQRQRLAARARASGLRIDYRLERILP